MADEDLGALRVTALEVVIVVLPVMWPVSS